MVIPFKHLAERLEVVVANTGGVRTEMRDKRGKAPDQVIPVAVLECVLKDIRPGQASFPGLRLSRENPRDGIAKKILESIGEGCQAKLDKPADGCWVERVETRH